MIYAMCLDGPAQLPTKALKVYLLRGRRHELPGPGRELTSAADLRARMMHGGESRTHPARRLLHFACLTIR
jgi:hypothetical protein